MRTMRLAPHDTTGANFTSAHGAYSVALVFFLSACAPAPTGYLRPGAEPPSFTDLREARARVKAYETTPAGAKSVVPIEALRCHREILDQEPTEELLRQDLLIEALKVDANGISDVTIAKEGGLLANCLYILSAKAKAFVVSR